MTLSLPPALKEQLYMLKCLFLSEGFMEFCTSWFKTETSSYNIRTGPVIRLVFSCLIVGNINVRLQFWGSDAASYLCLWSQNVNLIGCHVCLNTYSCSHNWPTYRFVFVWDWWVSLPVSSITELQNIRCFNIWILFLHCFRLNVWGFRNQSCSC